MDLRNLSDEVLLKSTLRLAQKERETTLEVLHHLREVERRSLFATLSYSSLFEYAVQELKLSQGSAHRRIASMRLLKELPDIEEKLGSGKLNLSSLAQAQSFFKQEKTSATQKREVLACLENKSVREVEKELVNRASEPTKLIPEKLRAVSSQLSELKLLVDEEFLKDLETLRALVSNQMAGASIKDVLKFAVKKLIQTQTPKMPKPAAIQKVNEVLVPAQNEASRHIPAEVKRTVWHRDRGQCSYNSNNKRCSAKHNLEFDHIKPFAIGGRSTIENLRLRCRAHNQLSAVQSFGLHKMALYISRMR